MSPEQLQTMITEAAELAGESVVTRALSRDVELPHGAGTAVLITVDNGEDHTRPNTFGPASLGALNTALDAARARDDVVAICLTGKPFILAAGADLSGVTKITEHRQARMIAEIGHEVFDKLATAPVPTFAFINGLALGGGLEVSLHCGYRTVSASAAGIGLPECFLGMLPGWGGTYLLPNLIGADGAVTVMIENALNSNRMLTGPQVRALGIADAMFEGADFLERSLDWAARVITGAVEVQRPEIDRGEGWDAALARGKQIAVGKIGKAAPGPHRALELLALARTADKPTAFEAENDALADLIMSDELRAGLYAFDLVQKRARKPAGAPDRWLARDVTKVGVVGAGLMARQLALLFCRRLQVPVIITDLDQARVESGVQAVRDEVDTLAGKHRIGPDQANRLKALVSGSTELADFADCDFVIEAVFEELQAKIDVFSSLEKYVGPDCVLATNTSSLSVAAMAEPLEHPERVIGFHFFNPVAQMPLLEVARTVQTDDATAATALAVARTLKKNAVLVADAPAFVVNRLLTRVMGEIIAAVDAGTPVGVADAALRPLGLPMSPMILLQLVGPAIALHVAETLQERFGDRFAVSPGLQALVSAGLPGVYRWNADGRPEVDEDAATLFGHGDHPLAPEEIFDRALTAVTEEVGLMLSENVVAAPMDLDLCMILGAGWPFHNGGIVPYLDRSGYSERVLGRRLLPAGVASVG